MRRENVIQLGDDTLVVSLDGIIQRPRSSKDEKERSEVADNLRDTWELMKKLVSAIRVTPRNRVSIISKKLSAMGTKLDDVTIRTHVNKATASTKPMLSQDVRALHKQLLSAQKIVVALADHTPELSREQQKVLQAARKVVTELEPTVQKRKT